MGRKMPIILILKKMVPVNIITLFLYFICLDGLKLYSKEIFDMTFDFNLIALKGPIFWKECSALLFIPSLQERNSFFIERLSRGANIGFYES
jgi:hypothetical protein